MKSRLGLLAATALFVGWTGVAQTPIQAVLDRVAPIHGAAGVFAVAGYRMGERRSTILARTEAVSHST